MRRVARLDLPPTAAAALASRQRAADAQRATGVFKVEEVWKTARRTKPLKAVLATLKTMTGRRERCMYCSDSHGTDIEHFWPKSAYPERLFHWPNLLLVCTACGRIKGSRFPLRDGVPLLIDPTAEEPWLFLDFDPATGNLVPRFDLLTGQWNSKGEETVRLLELDRREALATGYQATYRRIRALVETALQDFSRHPKELRDALGEADDHGLLGWCFTGTGQDLTPFCDLRRTRPDVWQACTEGLLVSGPHVVEPAP